MAKTPNLLEREKFSAGKNKLEDAVAGHGKLLIVLKLRWHHRLLLPSNKKCILREPTGYVKEGDDAILAAQTLYY
ncbi:MAG: hypothetical protein HY645_00665 [Acidobacteria bacterium]|nr:hypothetical protein [Acidobacteriota bacterium]